jgi:hypothetical protein
MAGLLSVARSDQGMGWTHFLWRFHQSEKKKEPLSDNSACAQKGQDR